VFSDGAAYPVRRFGGERAAARAFEQSGYLRSLRTLAAALHPADDTSAGEPVEAEREESLA
jgi:hypothetical protein